MARTAVFVLRLLPRGPWRKRGGEAPLLLISAVACALICFAVKLRLSKRIGRFLRGGRPAVGEGCTEIGGMSHAGLWRWRWNEAAVHDYDLPPWTRPFNRSNFVAYKRSVDRRIDEYRDSVLAAREPCAMPMFAGEYGYELAAMLPWAYHRHKVDKCGVVTEGVEGTKYLYFFSQQHTIVNDTYMEKNAIQLTKTFGLFHFRRKVKLRRKYQDLPDGNPFNSTRVHRNDTYFPQSGWITPPFKDFYWRDDVARALDRPLVVIFNKYTEEWGNKPVNYIPLDELCEILGYLTQTYYVVYIRLEHSTLDDDSKSCRFGDKDLIRSNFSDSVVVLDDLTSDVASDDVNLMIFSLAALSERFVSVQGGNSVVASFFGGTSIILAKNGTELEEGDYTYYHRFSNATVEVVNDERELIRLIKRRW